MGPCGRIGTLYLVTPAYPQRVSLQPTPPALASLTRGSEISVDVLASKLHRSDRVLTSFQQCSADYLISILSGHRLQYRRCLVQCTSNVPGHPLLCHAQSIAQYVTPNSAILLGTPSRRTRQLGKPKHGLARCGALRSCREAPMPDAHVAGPASVCPVCLSN